MIQEGTKTWKEEFGKSKNLKQVAMAGAQNIVYEVAEDKAKEV